MVELEAPVRGDAFGFLRGAPVLAHRERRAVVDRRQAAAQRDLALQLQLLRGLVGGIDPACVLQLGKGVFIQVEPLRLAELGIGGEPQPSEVFADRGDIFLAAALCISVVDPQQELARPLVVALPGEQPVVKRSAQVADVEAARG